MKASSQKIRLVRESVSKVVRMLTGNRIEVTQVGSNAYVRYDPITKQPVQVNIPVIGDDSSIEFLQAIQGFIDHEVGHVLFTDSEATIVSTKEGQWLNQLRNMIEDPRIEKKMKEAFKGSSSNLNNLSHVFLDDIIGPKVKELIDLGETAEEKWFGIVAVPVIRSLAGQEAFIDWIVANDIHDRIPTILSALTPLAPEFESVKSNAESLELARKVKKILDDLNKPTPESEKESGDSEESGEEGEKSESTDSEQNDSEGDESDGGEEGDEAGEPEDTRPSEDSDGEGEEGEEGEEDADEESDNDNDNEDGDGESQSGDGEDDPEDDGDSGSDDEDGGEDEDDGDQPEDGDSEAGDGDGDTDEDGDTDSEVEPDKGGNPSDGEEEKMDFDDVDLQDFEDAINKRIAEMAEESAEASPYVPFCTSKDRIEKYEPRVSDEKLNKAHSEVTDTVSHMVGPMQKKLERAFRAMNRSRYEHGKRSGRISPQNLYKLKSGDDRVFSNKQEVKTKKVAVSLVIDLSGSMLGGSAYLDGGKHMNKIFAAIASAYALGEVLSRLDINFEIIGFTTMQEIDPEISRRFNGPEGQNFSRAEAINMPIFKQFGEPFSAQAKRRLAYAKDHRSIPCQNIDGESLRYAADRLAKQPEPGKTIIVLSDGQPACSYAPCSVLEDHLKKVVRDLKKERFNLVGIGIMTNAVEKFYPKSVVLDDIASLPVEVLTKLRDEILAK